LFEYEETYKAKPKETKTGDEIGRMYLIIHTLFQYIGKDWKKCDELLTFSIINQYADDIRRHFI